MKHPIGKLSFLAILLYLTACTKTTGSRTTGSNTTGSNTLSSSNGNETAAIPPGAWNLVSDSTFKGVGSANHAVNYTGVAGDYFSFSTYGDAYTKEGNSLDTLTYQMFSDSSIIISDFGTIVNGVPDTCTITGLTSNLTSGPPDQTIVIESPFFLTPGGEFWRKVTLRR